MKKKIGVISDLHLEASNMSLNNPGWDYLCIVGDLSSEHDLIMHFFSYVAPTDIPIIYVLGNHEYEGKRLDSNVAKLKEMLRPFENVHLLDNESIIIDGIKFIGSTLWSNFELKGLNEKKKSMDFAKYHVVDFSAIFMKNEKEQYVVLTPEKMEKMNQQSCDFIEFELRKVPFEGPKVVLTHFAPHANSVAPKYKMQDNAYWVNNLEHLMGFSDYWFHGHTHNSFNYEVEGTKVVCNPRGFSRLCNIAQNNNFDPELYVDVDVPEPKKKLSM
jgi:predicted phosphodiesterase